MKIRRTLISRTVAIATLILLTASGSFAQGNSAFGRSNNSRHSSNAISSLIIQVENGIDIHQLASQHGFTVGRGVDSTSGFPTYVITGSNLDDLKQVLKSNGTVKWVANNEKLQVVPLDGGETVLPLDGGETVLPLDGGETVLPLGPGISTVTTKTINDALKSVLKTLDGGETVLPLDGGETVLPLDQIQAAYAKVAGLRVGSPGLILQPAFGKIGYFGAVLKTTGKGVTIADLDTGADTCHPALAGIFTYNFVDDEPNAPENCPTAATVAGPGFGHGTAVASLLRILAPEANVMSLRIFDSTGQADVATVYEAVVWAVQHGAKIINMSFGATVNSEALRDAVAYASYHNVLLTGAVGNSNQNAIMYPAAIQPTLGTAATDINDKKTAFSNYNSAVDVSAPGSNLVAAYPGNRWAIVWGTSYAAPMVAAEGALTLEAWNSQNRVSLDSADLRKVIRYSTDNINLVNPAYVGKLGTGRINM